MTRLPLLISVPHGGTRVPDEVEPYCVLSMEDVVKDGDEGAAEIYAPLQGEVAAFVTTDVARAIVDINRAEDDRRKDGVVKTHTCWDVLVYDPFPPEEIVLQLIAKYHRPYHRRLTDLAKYPSVRFGVDCHTMAAIAPPVAPDPGEERPMICLGNARGRTCSDASLRSLATALESTFERESALNVPFSGGYDVRAHAVELPWIQLEMSRTDAWSNSEKSERVRRALAEWCAAGMGL